AREHKSPNHVQLLMGSWSAMRPSRRAAERISARAEARADDIRSLRCQTRGGRKGGLPICERNELLSNCGLTLAAIDQNATIDEAVCENPKHLRAQAAIEAQPSIALSQGLASGGQQSSPIADMSDIPADFRATPIPAAAGSMATDRAITNARMVRPT